MIHRIGSEYDGAIGDMSDINELFVRCVAVHRAGGHAVAAQGYAAILSADPNHADAWHMSGLLAHQSGRSLDAITCINRAIERNPMDAEYASNLAAIQMSLGHWLSALEAAEHATRVCPSSAPAYFQKGRAHAALGQSGEAIAALQRSGILGFDPAQVSMETGTVLQSTGDLTGCVIEFEKSLAINPQQPSVWLSLSRLVTSSRYQFTDLQVEELVTLLSHVQTPRNHARIAFTLAAHCEQIGRYSDAFEYWELGNQCSHQFSGVSDQSYDPSARTQLVDDLIAVLTSRFLQSLPPVSDSGRPIIVVGMPRSGTSLIEQILASHPAVAAGGELSFWNESFESQFGMPETQQKLRTITTEWRQMTASGYEAVLAAISPNASHVVDKMPENYLYAGLIASAYPNATIVHCRRDPRDTCLSCYSQLFDDVRLQISTSNLAWLAQQYQDYDRLMRHWHRAMPGRITDLCYEQLVHDPETQVRRLLEACRLPWSPDCLNFHRGRGSVQTASAVQVRQPLYTSSHGRWTKYAKQLQPLLNLLKTQIADYAARHVD